MVQRQPRRPQTEISRIVDLAIRYAGQSGRALASKAGVAPETLSRLRSRGTGDFATVARLVRSAGLTLAAVGASETEAPGSGHARLDARSLALHTLIAGKILANPSLVKDKVLPTIRRFKRLHAGTGAVALLETWERAAAAGAEELVRLCIDPGERGQQCRQASPMTGILLPAERRWVYDAFPA